MNLQIINPEPRYSRASLIEPTGLGYLHLAATVSPSRIPMLPMGPRKVALLRVLKRLAAQLEARDDVVKVTVYRAIAMAPPSGYVRRHRDSVRVAAFDVVVLVETTSPQTARTVGESPEFTRVMGVLQRRAQALHRIAAHNIRRVGDVDKTRPGTFLFNYFVGDDPDVVVNLWDYLAGWYQVETGMDNSTLLAPLEGETSDYLIINHARWDGSMLAFLFRQMSKRTFRTYMLANLDANNTGAMPVLYRLA